MRTRLIFVRHGDSLHKVEGLSYQEVSEVMNTSVSSIESLMHRAKSNLKKSLENHYKQQQ